MFVSKILKLTHESTWLHNSILVVIKYGCSVKVSESTVIKIYLKIKCVMNMRYSLAESCNRVVLNNFTIT